ncbi:MAG: transporter [Cryobacterium sp.]|jgi:methionine-rich copper-binding protein CopC|nr:transporter [Cryobacterium sp.]
MTRVATRRWHGLAAIAVLVATMWGGAVAPAAAHDEAIVNSPATGAVVTEQPESFSITMSDTILNLGSASSAMQVAGPDGASLYYGDGCVSVEGAVAMTRAQLGDPGVYTVTWQVVSTDGHPVSGDFTFTWQPANGQSLAQGTTAPGTCGAAVAAPAPATSAPGGQDGAPVSAAWSDLAWIGGALGAVLLAGAGTLLLVRRKPAPPAE